MKVEANTHGPCKKVIHLASVVARFLNHSKAIVAISLILCSSSTLAETVSDSYRCALGEQSRGITLVYLENPNEVPCEIRESRNNTDSRALWRADNDSSFCRSQFESYRETLETNGWPCESVDSTDFSEAAAVASLTNSAGPVVSISTVSSTITVADPKPQASTQSNTFISNTIQSDNPQGNVTFSEQRLTPTPPLARDGNLTSEDIREMDDWLIYLSAQTMASIRRLVPDPDNFEGYLQQEQLDSSNIYERLQNRIEFLNKILSRQVSAPVNFTETEF